MAISVTAKELVAPLTEGNVKLGDVRKLAREIKKDYDLAMELWSTWGAPPSSSRDSHL